jgi:aminoglycoside 3-N-acetyltransferase
MAHAALRSVGPVVSGADAIIAAIRDAIGPDGTLMVYTDWEADMWGENTWELHEDEADLDLVVITPIAATREHVLPFDTRSSRAIRDNGALMELVRTLPGAHRSANPGASCAAIGPQAEWLTEGHSIDYGYGERSPFARLVEAEGKVLMLGATNDHMTLLHHAEHLADVPNKRVLRIECPFLVDGRTEWRWIEEFNTGIPVAAGLANDYFATLVADFLATGRGRRGTVGAAPSVVVEARQIVPFAVNWIETAVRSAS